MLVVATVLTLYVQALPLLVRSVFVWQGQDPDPSAVVPLQRWWWVFVLAGVSAALLRLLTEHRAFGPEVVSAIQGADQRQRLVAGTVSLPLPVARMVTATLSTLALAGVANGLWQGVVTFVFLYGLLSARDAIRATGRPAVLAAIPVFTRALVGVVASVLIVRVVLGFSARTVLGALTVWRTDSLVPAWIAVLLSTATVTLLAAPLPRPVLAAGAPAADR